ncbi:hypothetical protein HK100_006058 [Physocladia obscura]|uniref:Uncharacterized protein n=1 Tax=Physocladia obscura TaxID=109957 RepID=A0AAD5XG97_9FUNG|nr:hypothetical protein HK100_006058 [Physocladia obscura]
MWNGGVFDAVLPLYNIWAVFVASKERGIGVGGVPKDTAFGLYRDGIELRGIYPSKPEIARTVCKATGPSGCDYPSLIANDPYYGGLGGEFTIGTSSHTTGTLVLRHEFGHTMINVGEEYDGGEVYSGCNAARKLEKVGWKKWLTAGEDAVLNEKRDVLLVQDYSWYNLANGPYILNFTNDGLFDRWCLLISVSGVESADSLQVFLDGTPLNWTTRGLLDRQFYDWYDNLNGFAKGPHYLEFRQGFPPTNNSHPIRQLCSVSLHEYAAESQYHFDPNFIGAFPTYSSSGWKTYRPTHELCLMRNMSSQTFCPVCKEGLLLQLMRQVSLIDGIETKCTQQPQSQKIELEVEEPPNNNMYIAKLNLVPFAHMREPGKRVKDEHFVINWFKNGKEQGEFDGLEEILLNENEMQSGDWTVRVELQTPIVRHDPDQLLVSQERIVHEFSNN